MDSASDRPRSRTLRRRWASIAGPSPIASAVARSRTAPAWAVILRLVVEISTLGRAPGYLHFASASSVGKLVSVVAPFSLLRRPFLWICAPELSALLMVLSS